MKGANADRIKQQQMAKYMKPRDASRDGSKGARRQWRVDGQQDDKPQAYHNPVRIQTINFQFDVKNQVNPEKKPPQVERK